MVYLAHYFLRSDPPSRLGDTVYRNRQGYGDGVRDGNGNDGRDHGWMPTDDRPLDTWMPGCGVLIINIKKLNNVLVLVLQLVYCVMFYKACYNKEQTWFRSCSYMNGMLKNILLLRQGVESNPGPVMHKNIYLYKLYTDTFSITLLYSEDIVLRLI